MRRTAVVAVLVLGLVVMVAASPYQNPMRQSYAFTSSGGSSRLISLDYTESGGNPLLQYKFTTAGTVEYEMDGTSFYLGAANNIVGEGTTADDFETTLAFGDPTADNTITFPTVAATIGDFAVSWVQGGTAADALDTQIFVADKIYTVKAINVVWGVAESTGAMDVMLERLQGTEACAAGDDLQVAVVDATATANTVTTPALTATTALLTLAAGDRLCVDVTATPNEVANMVVSVVLGVG